VELRRARTKAKLTQKDVAQALDWSPSKVIRIESGQVAISTTDLKALLAEYGVNDRAVVADLVDLAKNSKKQPWSQYKDVLPQETQEYFGLESSASIIRQCEPLLVPGLLQTEEYTRVLMAEVFNLSHQVTERIVEARRERQDTLIREDVPECFFIIDEAVIRRSIGGADVMRAQLQRLLELTEHHRVTIQTLPFSAGAHQGLQGPFVVLEFAETEDEPIEADAEDEGEHAGVTSLDSEVDDGVEAENLVLYLESRGRSPLIRDQPELTGEYLERFLDLEKQAATPKASADMLKDVIKDF
jgi:transcriptional regulator with XRE-family HTH domain